MKPSPDLNKCLTVKQPYAYLQCAGIKDIENRTWRTKYRGRVYIHAAAKGIYDFGCLTIEQFDKVVNLSTAHVNHFEKYLHTSAIIGYVDIVDCVINHESIWAEKSEIGQDEQTNEWFKPTYNWVLANPVLFDKPILNVKGKLSFWNYPNIHSELDEDGKSVCMCNLGIDEKDQVMKLENEFRCVYCGGKWYK